jgi:hypothetical protein
MADYLDDVAASGDDRPNRCVQHYVDRWGVFGSDNNPTGVFAAFANGMIADSRRRAVRAPGQEQRPTDDSEFRLVDFVDRGVHSDYVIARSLTQNRRRAEAKARAGGDADAEPAPYPAEGIQMADALEYWRTQGILDCTDAKQYIAGYAAVRRGVPKQLERAVRAFGVAYIGLQVYKRLIHRYELMDAGGYADSPFPVWSSEMFGGRAGKICVPVVDIDINGDYLIVAWGRLFRMSPEYYEHACDEAWVAVLPGMLTGDIPVPGFRAVEFARRLARMPDTGSSAYAPIVRADPGGGRLTVWGRIVANPTASPAAPIAPAEPAAAGMLISS